LVVAFEIARFAEFELDRGRYELRTGDRVLKLEKIPMELLTLLVEYRGHLVTRSQIVEKIWGGGVFLDTEHGINTAIRKIRRALRDDPDQPRFLLTVTGKGYRFIGTVVEIEDTGNPDAAKRLQSPIKGKNLETAAAASTIQSDIPKIPPLDLLSNHIPSNGSHGQVDVDTVAQSAKKSFQPLELSRILKFGPLIAATVLAVFIAVRLEFPNWPARDIDRDIVRNIDHGIDHEIDQRAGQTAGSNIKSLAVLPLDNLTGDPAQEYFVDGMTDELITMLAKNSTLRVISRTSVMQYKGVHRPLPEVARELGVDGILEGSVNRIGNRVNVNIQLIQAPSDTHIWAESYDRDANDAVSLPAEAAQTIAKQLNRAVVRTPSTRFVRPEAHDAYLRGLYIWYAGDNNESAKYFKKATELQPDYALGWSGLANYYGAGAIEGFLPPEDALAQQELAATKAVELDDSLPEAHLALSASMFTHWKWARAMEEVDRAIELNPRYAEAYHFRARMYAVFHWDDQAIEAQKRSTELDPFARPSAMPSSYIRARRYDDAIKDARMQLEILPKDADLHWAISEAYRRKGLTKEAEQELEKSLILSGDQQKAATIRRAYKTGGYRAVLMKQLDDLKRKSTRQYVSPADLAQLYAQLDRREEALTNVEQAYRQRSPLFLQVEADPAFDFLHSDPRYRSIIAGLGLPERTEPVISRR
jgi:TolB-like protein/DNA-binding winged helix-turn-helix (wHTH) protein